MTSPMKAHQRYRSYHKYQSSDHEIKMASKYKTTFVINIHLQYKPPKMSNRFFTKQNNMDNYLLTANWAKAVIRLADTDRSYNSHAV